jgi:hypothetical protein
MMAHTAQRAENADEPAKMRTVRTHWATGK